VHGGVDTVNFLCDAPSIRAISFVGGNLAGEHIFDRGTKNGKRVQVRTCVLCCCCVCLVYVMVRVVLNQCENSPPELIDCCDPDRLSTLATTYCVNPFH
jgi:hypothetical protein